MRWMYSKNTARWEMTFGGWRASVRSRNVQGTWQASIRRRYPPYDACGQADFGWPHSAMVWCEDAIMRQRWSNLQASARSTAKETYNERNLITAG